MGLLKLAERHSESGLESACEKALSYTASPSYKSIKNILATGTKEISKPDTDTEKSTKNIYGLTRGANYYGGKGYDK